MIGKYELFQLAHFQCTPTNNETQKCKFTTKKFLIYNDFAQFANTHTHTQSAFFASNLNVLFWSVPFFRLNRIDFPVCSFVRIKPTHCFNSTASKCFCITIQEMFISLIKLCLFLFSSAKCTVLKDDNQFSLWNAIFNYMFCLSVQFIFCWQTLCRRRFVVRFFFLLFSSIKFSI